MSDEKKVPPTETSTPAPTQSLSALADKFDGCRRDNVFGIPDRYLEYGLCYFPEDWITEAVSFIRDGADTLFLTGDIGSRKTAFAAAILRAWRWTHPEYPETWRNGIFLPTYWAADVLRNIDRKPLACTTLCGGAEDWQNTPLLVLDDVGSNRATAFLAEQLLFLLEKRYDWNQQTIVTTNLSLAEFGKNVDPRAASRLQQGIVLDCGDKDWRQGD